MVYKFTGGWNGGDGSVVFGLVGTWLSFGTYLYCERHYCYSFFFFFRNSACFIEREVVVGGQFRASQMLRLEWLAWWLA